MAPTKADENGNKKQMRAPEAAIPDLPENRSARDFLKNAPSKGLWLPMGVQVKVMQCWRCKAFGHRTGDRECPMATAGNLLLDAERQAREDPMAKYMAVEQEMKDPVAQKILAKKQKKREKREQLERLLLEIRQEQKEKRKKKMMKKKKNSGKRRRRESITSNNSINSSSSSSSSDSSSSSASNSSSDSDDNRRRHRKRKRKLRNRSTSRSVSPHAHSYRQYSIEERASRNSRRWRTSPGRTSYRNKTSYTDSGSRRYDSENSTRSRFSSDDRKPERLRSPTRK